MHKFTMSLRWRLLFGAIIIGGIIVFITLSLNTPTDTSHPKEPIFTHEIENSTKETTYEFETTFEDKRTSGPKFEVGEKYTYHIMMVPTTQKDVIAPPFDFNISMKVDRTERINKTECYVLKIDSVNVSIEALVRDENGVLHYFQEPSEVFGGVEEYIDKESGNETYWKKLELEGIPLPSFYESWMLSLKENFRWKSKGAMKDFIDKETLLETVEEGKVKGIEEVNNRKCFVVEVIQLNSEINKGKTTYQILNKDIYWVDVEKRVLVKYQRFEGGILTFEINLINYEKSKK